METVVQRPVESDLHLLTEWGDADGPARRRKALAATVAVHVGLILTLAALPPIMAPNEVPQPVHIITPLIEPPTELTQKAPNRSKISAEFELQPSAPRPRLNLPPGPEPAPHEKPRPAVIPQSPAPKPEAQISLPEPPKVDTGVKEPKIEVPQIAQAPPPPAPTVEKPKMVMENLGGPKGSPPPGQSQVPIPNTSIAEAVHNQRGTGLGGAAMGGDPGAADPNIFGGINQPPSPGTPLAGFELKSDPMGVDFRPYLTQVLATVRRNWMAVYPESARLGLRGRVSLQIRITRNGIIAKLVYAQQSGSHALNEAAVAGVSTSNPLPSLPGEFRGDHIDIQLNFVYNAPHR
ncbi:MAG: TonB family protein [Bryobacteraceae bacterium]|jgi:colicin import membrane protein